MAAYADLVSKLHYQIIGCPYPIMLQALKDSYTSFCEHTYMHTESIEVPITAGQREYTLTPTEGYYPLSVIEVMLDNTELHPVFEGEMEQEWRTYEGTPTKYFLDYDKTLILKEIPKEDATLTVKLAVKPKKNTSADPGIPDGIYEDWEDVIIAGAASTLYGMRGKEWSSQRQAEVQYKEFRSGLTRAKAMVRKSFVNKSIRVAFQPYGG